MPEYSAPPPELVIYPSLWQRSRERFPHDWQWPDQLRYLCELAADYRANNRPAYRALPDGERLFLQALATVDVPDLICSLKNDYAAEANPMLRISPDDPYVDRSQYPNIYRVNGKRYHA